MSRTTGTADLPPQSGDAHESHLDPEHRDPILAGMNRIIRHGIRVLAGMMVLVILWCIADVVLVLYEKLSTPPLFLLELNDIFVVFAAFLAVLIAIEIFANIALYLRDDVIHVKLVVATALMAIARKVIVLDLGAIEAEYLFGIGLVVIALGVTYWLVANRART